MKRETRLYNIIFPVWLLLLWPVPPVILLTLLGNLAIDSVVLYWILRLRGVKHRGQILKQAWWRVWRNGFAADLIGAAWLVAGLFVSLPLDDILPDRVIQDFSMAMTVNPFLSPLALLWTAIGAAIASCAIYFFDRRSLRRCGDLLSGADCSRASLWMAILTAPWVFFIPAVL